jgi:hypothetical protein
MTEGAQGMTALMIPNLPTNAAAVNVRPAAREHLMAWDATSAAAQPHRRSAKV